MNALSELEVWQHQQETYTGPQTSTVPVSSPYAKMLIPHTGRLHHSNYQSDQTRHPHRPPEPDLPNRPTAAAVARVRRARGHGASTATATTTTINAIVTATTTATTTTATIPVTTATTAAAATASVTFEDGEGRDGAWLTLVWLLLWPGREVDGG